jgi:hypothetical protein
MFEHKTQIIICLYLQYSKWKRCKGSLLLKIIKNRTPLQRIGHPGCRKPSVHCSFLPKTLDSKAQQSYEHKEEDFYVKMKMK